MIATRPFDRTGSVRRHDASGKAARKESRHGH
jgi:hypothetical protein